MSKVPKVSPLTIDKLNVNVVNAKYAVRGRLAIRAEQLKTLIQETPSKYPFKSVINANIGNPQQLDQKPITFYRQVLSLVEYPQLLDKPETSLLFKADAIARAKKIISQVGSIGAYSNAQGVHMVRSSVAKFIEKRDGFPADTHSIFLTSGASSAVNMLLNAQATGSSAGFLIPIPQYPLYSATLTMMGAAAVQYHLDEANNWATNVDEISKIVDTSKAQGIDLKTIVVINPGNPTGTVLDEANIRGIIDIAAEHGIVIIADEVYQANVYRGEFVSFKKVLCKMQAETPHKYDTVQLASLHSTSKGMIGECGHRGGYMELVGFNPEVIDTIYKLAAVQLCATVPGQVAVELMVNPPLPGEESYEEFTAEYTHIFNTLKHRANVLYEAFKTMEGVSCQEPEGAMYLFPQIALPPKAIAEAKRLNEVPDEFYCLEMLEETGICVIPGSGFGQKDGTWHFRTTFLAPVDDYAAALTSFHKKFMDKYRD